MRFVSLLATVSASLLVAAHGDDLAERAYNMRRALLERQGPSSASPPASPASSPPASATTPVANSTTTLPTVVLASTNPTAISLSLITSLQSLLPTKPLASTPTAGTSPTIPGAPRLPDVSKLIVAKYPPLDKVPPTDSDEVKGWIADVNATGIIIPSYSQTFPGGCANNTAVSNDQCWWSCTGCTGKTDITNCPTTNDWGLTYDDGPGNYTANLLEYLDSQQLKSTFFVVGSRVLSVPRTVQYEYISGHQIAVHTWSHAALTRLTNDEIIAELGWSKKVIKDVLGVTPNMMRPPFGDIDDRVRAISVAMGLTPVMWTRIGPQATFDTDDFNIHGGTTSASRVLQNWQYIIGNIPKEKGFIVLSHDLFLESVEIATGYILPDALAHTNPSFHIKPVASCLGLNPEDAYIETNDNKKHPPALEAAVSAHGVSTTSSRPTSTSKSATSSGVDTSIPVSHLALAVLTGMVVAVSIL